MRILREPRFAFAIECRFNELHFELFHGIFLLFHIDMKLFSYISMGRFIHYAVWFRFDPETGTGCRLRNRLLLFPQLSQSLYTLPFPALFKDRYIYIYIYIYILSYTDCFVVSQLFSVVGHVGCLKLGEKLDQLCVRLSIRPLGQQAYHVG